MGEVVKLEVADRVAIVTLDRPPMNAISAQVIAELGEIAQEAAESDEIGALVLWGGKKIFAAGADISEFPTGNPGNSGNSGGSSVSSGDRGSRRPASAGPAMGISGAFSALADLPKVTIAAINGYALGGGCELALCCDFRFAGDDARLGQPEILLGIIPGAGGTQRLPRLVGPAKAKDIVFSGRRVDAQEALSIGLVDRVYPADEVFDKALEEARKYAKGPLVALKAAKKAINNGLETDLKAGLEIETREFAPLFATEDARIGIKSFFEKGPGKAEFVGK